MRAAWNVKLKPPPELTTPESNAPPSAVNVCGADEGLLNATLPPRPIVIDEGLKAKPDPPLTARTEALIGGGTGVGFGVGFGVGAGVAGTGVGVTVGGADALVVGDAVADSVAVGLACGIAACWVVLPQAVSNSTSVVVAIRRCMSPGATRVGYATPDARAR